MKKAGQKGFRGETIARRVFVAEVLTGTYLAAVNLMVRHFQVAHLKVMGTKYPGILLLHYILFHGIIQFCLDCNIHIFITHFSFCVCVQTNISAGMWYSYGNNNLLA